MAFFGPQNSGGLFGLGGQQQTTRPPIVGISTSLIALDVQARLAAVSVNSLSAEQRAAQFSFDRGPAVSSPQLDDNPDTLNERIREVREITNFIDLNAPNLEAVEDNVDQTATFVLFNALSNLRTLAEFASEDRTPLTSLARLDEQFQTGISQVRDYLSSTELDQLDIFLGDRESSVEATTRTGRNQTDATGSFIVGDLNGSGNADAVVPGLTGTEVFTVSIEKAGETDDIVVDLSGISGDLTLAAVRDHINAQIEALQVPVTRTLSSADFNSTDENLQTVRIDTTTAGLQLNQVDVVDGQEISLADIQAGRLVYTPPDTATPETLTGFQFSVNEGSGFPALPSTYDTANSFGPEHQTRFDITRNGSTGQFGLQIEGTLTEEVTLSAQVTEPTVYVVSAVSQLDDSFAVTSRVTEFNNLTGTLTRDDTTSFVGIDYDETEISGRVAEEEGDDLDPDIVSLRDQFLADAAADVNSNNDDSNSSSQDEEVDNSLSITNIDAENRVNSDTSASRVAVDSDGGIYVVGTSAGSFGHQLNTAETQDVFLTKFDTEGNVVFSRLLGVAESAEAFDIQVDSQDNVIIAGATESAITNSDVIDGGRDAFVAKFDKRGTEVFRFQLDTFADTSARAIAIDSNNDIYVGGSTAAISFADGSTSVTDALVLKLNGSTGALTDSNVFGGSGSDAIKGLAVDSNNDLIVGLEESGSASVVRLSGTDLSTQNASVTLGSLGSGGSISSLTVDDANGRVYVSGITTNSALNASGTATVNETAAGGFEGFVSGLSFSGTSSLSADFTTYLSTSGTDSINDVTVQGGKVYVAGSTAGTLAGETARGATDGFVARIDGTSGALENVEQFGESLSRSQVGGIAFTDRGNSVLETLGLPSGLIQGDQTLNIETQTSAREGDFFYIRLNEGRRQRIELDAGDDFGDIRRKIRVAGLGQVEVDVSRTSEGDRLKISALNDGVAVDLIPGSNGRDLLSRIGIEPGRLLPRDEILGLNQEDIPPEEDLGGAFGLQLDGALNLRDRATSRFVLGLLDDAIGTVQRAFRSTRFDPIRQALLNQSQAQQGTPSPRTLSQISNFQTALTRLQSGASSPTVSLFT